MKTPPNTITGAFCLLAVAVFLAIGASSAQAHTGSPEKPDLKLGFIKLTDMAPLAVAWERGFFLDEGLFVELEAQANWKVLLNRVITGELDGAQMLAGQPLGAAIGYGTQADIITAFSMNLNGNGITVSNDVWKTIRQHLPVSGGKPAHPISASTLKPAIDQFRAQGKLFRMGTVFPVSSHNYELRYWLAAGGLHPGYYAPQRGNTSGTLEADVHLSVTPPPQMPATLDAGTIQGYCVGEPWNQQARLRGIGVPVITDYEIWSNNPEKVFGVTRAWANENPDTHLHLLRALIRAAYWLDENNNANRAQAVNILARPNYVGADAEVIASAMTGTFEYEKGDIRKVPDFNVFFRHYATYPYPSDGIWYLTQMRRWGQIPEARPDDWYMKTAARVYRGDIYAKAARSLIDDGLMTAGDFPDFSQQNFARPYQGTLIDGVTFTPHQPNDYINRFNIGLKGSDTP